jgi:hypothetical protein
VKTPAILKDNIHTILYGTPEEKRQLRGKQFQLADTPDFMKETPIGLTGDYFTVRYGVAARHLGKDAIHDYTEETWRSLCKEITEPFAIARYGECSRRLFTSVKLNGNWVAFGVDVKVTGKGIKANSITTVFGFKPAAIEEIFYIAEKITPEQKELLVRLFRPLRSAQGSNAE